MFLPLGFHASSVPLPTIASPLFAMDFSLPLNSGNYKNGATALTAYGQICSVITDLFNTPGGSAATVTTGQTLDANIQFGRPGLLMARARGDLLYSQPGANEPNNRIPAMQGTSPTPAPFTLFLVTKLLSVPTAGQTYRLFSVDRDANTDANLAGCTSLFCTSTGFTFVRNAAAATNAATLSVPPVAGKVYKIVARFTNFSTAMKFSVNSYPEVSITPSGAMETFAWDILAWMGGSYNASVQDSADGRLLEGRVWNTACSDAQRSALLNYAARKWGT